MTTKIENNIPLAFDYKFKKLFGDEDNIKRLETLISLYFNIPIDEVSGNIMILNSEKRLENKKDKKGATDVYLKLLLKTGNERIDIEVSNEKLSQSIIERNVAYGVYYYTKQLKRKADYKDLEPVIIINFDKGYDGIESDKIIEKYSLRNEDGKELTKKLQIHHVNIEKCYNIWYSKDVEKYNTYEQNIIRIGALLRSKNREEFKVCLGGIPMDEEVREDIESTNSALNEEDDILSWYDYEEDLLAKHKARMADDDEKDKKFEEKRIKFEEDKANFEEEKSNFEEEKSNFEEEKSNFEEEKSSFEEERLNLQEEKKNLQEEKNKLIQNLKEQGVSIDTIAKAMGLTVEEINKL